VTDSEKESGALTRFDSFLLSNLNEITSNKHFSEPFIPFPLNVAILSLVNSFFFKHWVTHQKLQNLLQALTQS